MKERAVLQNISCTASAFLREHVHRVDYSFINKTFLRLILQWTRHAETATNTITLDQLAEHKSLVWPNTMKILDAETITELGLAAQESPRRRTALSGAMDLLFFAEDGTLNDRVPLRMDGTRLVEYAADAFHAAVILEHGTMVFEVKNGPYDPATAKELPDWAPNEGSDEAEDFNARMRTLRTGASA